MPFSVLATSVLWLANTPNETCEEMIVEELDQYGSVLSSAIDKQTNRALIFFDGPEDAYSAYMGLAQGKGEILGSKVMVSVQAGVMVARGVSVKVNRV